ncbi:hypothetical protein [Nocardia crassostreae]|uniref:hypothetical protein n=1 Tax=Nocardia crassostreae TaxID=53428 RepID=UPI0009FCFAF9|nr:hypothetical protein [Nocardia crassostreae]
MITREVLCAFSLTAVAAVLFSTTGCGADDSHAGHTPTATQRATSPKPPPTTTLAAPTVTVPAVGEVPGNANAAAALQPWVRDLVAGDTDELVRKCWTIEPQHAREMYADKNGILAAIGEPGIDGQFAVSWQGPVRTVSVKRGEIASGYACPYVRPTGSRTGFTEADARYAVYRYLSRWVGRPVDSSDVEGAYPLVCAGSVLAGNPGRLTGTTAFGESTSRVVGRDDVEVSVPVTNSSGVTGPLVFATAIGPEGYCINDISG